MTTEDIQDKLDSVASILQDVKEQQEKSKLQRMENLQKKMASLRDEAVRYKNASGIVTIFNEDNEYYEGIDDLNRATAAYNKPYFDGPLQRADSDSNQTQCTAFFNVTRQFVDSAAARCGDILLPAGDWNWGVKKQPISEGVVKAVEQMGYNQQQEDQNALMIDAGERRIKDWLASTRYHREYRRAIEYAAKLGTGVLKGPFPTMKTFRAVVNGEVVTKQEIVPTTKAVDPHDVFPDGSCGDDIQKGDCFFERDYITYKGLTDLAKDPSYFPDAIKKVLKEGPKQEYEKNSSKPKETDLFEIWYGYANIDMNDMDLIDERFEKEISFDMSEEGELCMTGVNDDEDRDKDFQPIVIVMVNDTIIQGHMNPLGESKFPYRFLTWQRRDGSPFGVGVARQGRVAQQMLLSAARDLIDNMGISSMPMIAVRREGVIPADGRWELTKGKVWWLSNENIRAVNEAIQFLAIPSLQKELMEIIMLAGKMFEDATGVNSLLQGQQGSAPDTVGGMELLNKNASALLRRIARISDEDVTEPLIIDYYNWLLLYGEDSEKGDFEIEAFGSSILVEREIQEMQAQTLLQYAQDPSYGLSKSKIMSKIVDSWGFDSSAVMMDEQEKAALQEQQGQPQQDPRIQVAQMNIEKDLQIAQQNAQLKQMEIQKDQDRDAIFAQGVTERNRIAYETQIQKMQLEERLEMLRYANENKMTLDKIKADLSSDAMKLSVQKELASLSSEVNPAKQVIAPPTEPPQQAPDGQAYQQ